MSLSQRAGELVVQARGLRADDRDVGQPDRSPAQRRDPVRDDGADRLLRRVRAHPRGAAVAEHEELHGVAQPGAIASVVVRGTLERLADQTPGEFGLDFALRNVFWRVDTPETRLRNLFADEVLARDLQNSPYFHIRQLTSESHRPAPLVSA